MGGSNNGGGSAKKNILLAKENLKVIKAASEDIVHPGIPHTPRTHYFQCNLPQVQCESELSNPPAPQPCQIASRNPNYQNLNLRIVWLGCIVLSSSELFITNLCA